MQEDKQYMYRCLQLARLGKGRVSPNPMVGCVIVHNGVIIGEGYHQTYGQAHAEVNAIKNVKDKTILNNSTLYVSLEPCSHQGKTPPCADLIIRYAIPHVVIACQDPNPAVSGNGIARLKQAGINVTVGLLEKESKELNAHFFTFHTKKRPYITLKWARSSDGFIDGTLSKPIQISNETTKTLVHKLRSENMSILVGTNTAIKDNPSLRTRRWYGKNPLRITIDKQLLLPKDYLLYNGLAETIIFNDSKNEKGNPDFIKIDFNQNVIEQIIDELYKRKINSLIVEGGKILLDSFINNDLYDEVQEEIAPCILDSGTLAPTFNFTPFSIIKYGENISIKHIKNK